MKLARPTIHVLRKTLALLSPIAGLLVCQSAHAQAVQQVGNVWVIDMENRNWTQPSTDTSAPAQILGSSAAPYINSLVTPGNANAKYVAYASEYHNVLSTPSGSNPSIHPSEPNYLWQEAGSNFSIANDNDPYTGSPNQMTIINNFIAANPSLTGQNLCGLLQAAGISWLSYQEGIDLQNTTGGNGNISGLLTNTVLAPNLRTVPTSSFSGTSASYTNPYNGSHQYNFAVKHDGSLFFTATNGGTLAAADTTTTNPEVSHYAPLEQLATDLANNTCASYNLITPDQFNDMHTALSAGYTYPATGVHYTGDLAQMAQGDNFLSIVVPEIMASAAWQNNGVIIIWTDETEGTNQNDFNHTLMEIVISKLAKGNATLVADDLTHSSDLATLQDIFHVTAKTPSGYINDAANPSNGTGTANLANFFQPGVIVQDTNIPAMPWWAITILALVVVAAAMRFLPRKKTA